MNKANLKNISQISREQVISPYLFVCLLCEDNETKTPLIRRRFDNFVKLWYNSAHDQLFGRVVAGDIFLPQRLA